MTPDAHTNQEFFLNVPDGHQLYVQDWGNPRAKNTILFLHGGPGSNVSDKYKTTFDPSYERVIFFDQRGCGKSLPKGSRIHNTTDDLVEDIEKLLIHLKLDAVIITGGSWGSCLALAFSLKYPKRVKAMVLRGIFTGSQSEIDWLDKGQYKNSFPDVWETYLAHTPKNHQHNPSGYHFDRALGEDPMAAKASAYAYENVEGALMALDERYTPESFDTYDPSGIQIEIYYLKHRCFMPDRYILENAHKLTMPIWLIQGRYDMVCPPVTAYELHKQLPHSHLVWTVAGHGNERPNFDLNKSLLLQMVGSL